MFQFLDILPTSSLEIIKFKVKKLDEVFQFGRLDEKCLTRKLQSLLDNLC